MDAKIVTHDGIRTTDLRLPHQKRCALAYLAFFCYAAIDIILSNKIYYVARAIDITHKMKNESVKKPLENKERSRREAQKKSKT